MDGKPPFISAFIELYRAYPCLWKVKDDSYANKRSRDEAYELKKVKQQKSGSSGDDAYTPSLWYFDLLLFTADHEETRATIGSEESQLESQDETSNHTSSQLVSPPSPVASLSWSDSILSGPSTSSGNTKKSGNQKKRKYAIDAAVKALKEDEQIPCSFGQDENLFQTTNNFNPITGEGSTRNEYLVSADADSDNQLSEFLLLK